MIKKHSSLDRIRRFALTLSGIAALGTLTNSALGDEPRLFDQKVSGVPAANQVIITDNTYSPEFAAGLIVEGLDLLENPAGPIARFGNLSDGSRTEPDENTYLIFDHNPGGPTPDYDYGRHFLFQGHEMPNGTTNGAYVTRINLDVAHPDHRITLLTPGDANFLTGFNSIDGSTWDPFSRTLLFTQEDGAIGGVIEMGPDFDPATGAAAGLRTLYGSLGRGGYEGIHPDDRGNILIVEDVGGTTLPEGTHPGEFGRNPNSFVYRFVPKNTADLSKGKLQALQVFIGGSAVTFVPVDAVHPTGDVLSDTQLKLHTVGASWPCRWVTIHDTDIDTSGLPFDANAAAKTAGATPFKRPENGQFVPDSKFQSFIFDVTGDTDAIAGNQPELAARGAWGGLFRVDLDNSRDTGMISLIVLGDADHASFDNVTFGDKKDTLFVTEDRGDKLHDQLNKLDSVWAYSLSNDPKKITATRLVALGQDRVAGVLGEEDNEPTGLHMSEGDPTITGLLGTKQLEAKGARLFFTQQHGENNLFEISSGQ